MEPTAATSVPLGQGLPVAVIGLDGALLAVNPALCALVGREREQLLGRRVPELCASDVDRAEAESALQQAREGQDAGELRRHVTAADGSVRTLRITWTLMHDASGAPSSLTAVLVDETERIEADEARAADELRWRALLAHAADVTFTADEDGRISSATSAVHEQLGWKPEDLVGLSAFDLAHPDDVPAARAAWQRLVSGVSAEETLEHRVVTADGGWTWARTTVRDLRDEPHVRSFVGHLVDATERRRGEAERARQEARDRARFEQSTAPQVMVDAEGRFAEVNDAFCALTGMSRDELLGRSATCVVHPDDDGGAERVLGRVMAGELDSAQVEQLVRGADGRPVPVWGEVTVLRDERGAPDGLFGIVRDVTALRRLERRRAREEEFFRAVSARANDLAIVSDETGLISYVSPAVEHLYGYTAEQVAGGQGWAFIHPDDLDSVRRTFAAVVAEGASRTVRMRLHGADGEWVWTDVTYTNLLDTAVGGVVANIRVVAEQVAAEEALRASEARYRAIVETAEEGIWVAGTDGRTVYVNERAAAIVGRPLEELYAQPLLSLFPPQLAAEVESRLRHRHERGAERYEVTYRHPDGGDRRVRISASPLRAGDVQGSLAMLSDVTEVHRVETELREAALHDALTYLPNRALLQDRLTHALESGRGPTSVLFLDLDQFKLVNDSRGHDAGDELLLAVADRLRRAVPPGDTVARFGGDEFVVVCEACGEEEATRRGEALLAALADPVEVAGTTVHVSASIGLAVSTPSAPLSAGDLLRYADTAMYAAKASGRGRVQVFDRALAVQAEERYALAAELRTALADDALTLHFQPVVDLRSGRVLGMEALARWSSARGGPVDPARFVASAETTGLAPELDRWALRTALREAGRLRASGAVPADCVVGVNVSARDLVASGLEDVAAEWADEAGLPAEHVVLEITESAIMNDPDRAVPLLRRLRDRGFGIAVDDFGTGFSSLAQLRQLPVTHLKIDRSFVADMTAERDASAIVSSIIDLARAVGATTVAEGVETVQQASLLRRLGCRAAQGWLWSPAVPPDEVRLTGAWNRGFDVGATRSRTRVGSRRDQPVPGPEHGRTLLLALHADGASAASIASALNSEGYRAPSGALWHRTAVVRALAELATEPPDDDIAPSLGRPPE